MGKTKIEWTKNADGSQGSTWNPLRGCSRISPGCGGGGSFSGEDGEQGGCYAEGIAARFSGEDKNGKLGEFHGFAEMTDKGPRWTRKVALIPEKLLEPLTVRKPMTWFISMSDPFHEHLTDVEIAAIFGVMVVAGQHTFQVLTKRSARMREWFASFTIERLVAGMELAGITEVRSGFGPMTMTSSPRATAMIGGFPWPLPNVWLGVSVEAEAYKFRLDHLRTCPAAVRFCSLEPLLEPLGEVDFAGINQAIVGAESGRSARPMFEDWVRPLRNQAVAQGTSFFYKQKLGPNGKKVSLPILDGQRWAQIPIRST